MPTRLTRALVLLNAALVAGSMAALWPMYAAQPGWDLAFAEFAVRQGEFYDPDLNYNLVFALVFAAGAIIVGWLGLWFGKRWGVFCYAPGLAALLLSDLLDPSTVVYFRPLETVLFNACTLASGTLLGVGLLRLSLGQLDSRPLLSPAPSAAE